MLCLVLIEQNKARWNRLGVLALLTLFSRTSLLRARRGKKSWTIAISVTVVLVTTLTSRGFCSLTFKRLIVLMTWILQRRSGHLGCAGVSVAIWRVECVKMPILS